MISADYATNRARFPWDQLEKYRGQWVAFNSNGCHVVGSALTLEELQEGLLTTGDDLEQVVFERIPGPEDDTYLGGTELV